ncbi:unnamed protein product [Rotaria socialis]
MKINFSAVSWLVKKKREIIFLWTIYQMKHFVSMLTRRVYTIDPLTQSIVLIDDSSNRVHIVLRPDIIQLIILDRNQSQQSHRDPFLPSNAITTTTATNHDESIRDRLGNIRKFLSSKRIPFQEKLEENNSITLLIQNGIVQINAPYTPENISGTNEIVLSRIKLLLKQIVN